MAAPSLTYTLTNGQTADATQVMQNFNDLLNGITDGTKDLSISALTLAGTLTANGNVTLGNASSDTVTITGSLASNLVPSADATYGLGSSSIGYTGIYFGANSQRVRIVPSSSTSASWTMTLPTTAGTANYILKTDGNGVTSWTPITDSNWYATVSTAGTVSATTQTFNGVKTFDDGLAFTQTATSGTGVSSVASTMQAYETFTWATTITNFTSTPAATFKFTRVGSHVTCVMTDVVSDANKVNGTNPVTTDNLPVTVRPASSKIFYIPVWIKENSVDKVGILQVDGSTGLFYWRLADGSAWTNGAGKAANIEPFAVSWTTV